MKVILFSSNNERFKEVLKDYNFDYESDYESLKKNIKDYEGLIAFGLGKDIDLSHLKWIQSLGAGVDWITTNPSVSNNTLITRVTEGLNEELFEYVLTRILFYYQNLSVHHNNQQKNIWERKLSSSITGRNVLIVGTGKIGLHIGKELNKLKMNVYGINSSGYDIEGFNKTYTFDTLDTNIKYDVVVNILPATPDTYDIFNVEFFNKVNMDVFINVGRGTAVDVDALVKELNNNKIKVAFLDVFKEEPLDKNSHLWQTKNLVITPHIAAFTNAKKLSEAIINNYENIINNKEVELVDLKKGY